MHTKTAPIGDVYVPKGQLFRMELFTPIDADHTFRWLRIGGDAVTEGLRVDPTREPGRWRLSGILTDGSEYLLGLKNTRGVVLATLRLRPLE